ncbi:MAG TPA: class E sortase [Acidimicrobiales bacterium]
MKVAKVLGAIGRTMITAGVLILLFVVYQLYGTGIREAQAQSRLKDQFNHQIAGGGSGEGSGSDVIGGSSSPSSTSSSSSGSQPPTSGSTPADSAPPTSAAVTTTSIAPPTAAPAQGDVVGKIEIPKIGLSAYVVEGVGDDDLKMGPGHYPGTPLPGQQGNASIAGHRTTYGAPFGDVDALAPGDKIMVTTVQGTFTYAVSDPPNQIVSPSAVDVLDDKGDNRLTLTSCHPKFSASQRIVVTATLQGTALPAPPPSATSTDQSHPQISGDVSGESAPKLPVILYALVCAAIWIGAWLVGKRWRKLPAYAIGLPFFLVALFYFFENFSRLLPANY